MKRPTGVSVIAVLCFIGAALCILAGIGVMAGGGMLATIMGQQAEGGPAAAGIMAGLGVVIGVVILAFGALYGVVGWGLLALKEWARLITIVLSGLSAVLQLPGLVRALTHFRMGGLVWAAFWLAVNIVIVWYMLKPEVKAAFESGQARPASA